MCFIQVGYLWTLYHFASNIHELFYIQMNLQKLNIYFIQISWHVYRQQNNILAEVGRTCIIYLALTITVFKSLHLVPHISGLNMYYHIYVTLSIMLTSPLNDGGMSLDFQKKYCSQINMHLENTQLGIMTRKNYLNRNIPIWQHTRWLSGQLLRTKWPSCVMFVDWLINSEDSISKFQMFLIVWKDSSFYFTKSCSLKKLFF